MFKICHNVIISTKLKHGVQMERAVYKPNAACFVPLKFHTKISNYSSDKNLESFRTLT